MKIVVVSQRIDFDSERNERRDALDHRLVKWLITSGFIPVPVPNSLGNNIHAWLSTMKPEAFILSGGNDIGKCLDRDATEQTLLAYAKKNVLPLLAICRGMQMMGYWFGMSLHPVAGHIGVRHKLYGEISTEVNSYHRYSLSNCNSEFEVISRSTDGEIEAIRHHSLPWEGWMWHPEREDCFTEHDIIRLQLLFK